MNRLEEKASAYAHKTWQTWEKSEKGFGKKMYDFAQKLLEKIDPDEDVLKAIPSKAPWHARFVRGNRIQSR